jgi:hypothetical protein
MATVSMSEPMNDEGNHFGSSLRLAREGRALTLGDVSVLTKVPRSSLVLIEAGDLAGLPADVFVRGFIRSYARAVGISEIAPLAAFDRALHARNEAARAESVLPVVDPIIAGVAGIATQARAGAGAGAGAGDGAGDPDESSSRRGLGLAVFVIILLLIATITLSLLLRRPPPSGEGLSQSRPAPAAPLAAARAPGPPPDELPPTV